MNDLTLFSSLQEAHKAAGQSGVFFSKNGKYVSLPPSDNLVEKMEALGFEHEPFALMELLTAFQKEQGWENEEYTVTVTYYPPKPRLWNGIMHYPT